MAEFTLVDQDDSTLTSEIPQDVMDWYRRSVDAGHNNPEIINTIGDIFLRSGRIQEAITCFSQVAKQYVWLRDRTKSIAVLKKISKLTPSDPDVLVRIGDLLAAEGRMAEARTIYLSVGDSQYIDDQADGAMAAYEKAISIDGSDASLHMMLGGIYQEQQMPGKAHSSFISARREFLKKGRIGLARHAAFSARSLEDNFEFGSVLSGCRRRDERYSIKLPTVVMGENGNWCERTTSLNVSKSGIRFGLVRPLERDRVVGLLMPVPAQLGLGTRDDFIYAVEAMICNAEVRRDGQCLVGAEFGKMSRVPGETVPA